MTKLPPLPPTKDQKLMMAIAGPARPVLPTSKLILIPGESGPSPADITPSGCPLIYNESFRNAKQWRSNGTSFHHQPTRQHKHDVSSDSFKPHYTECRLWRGANGSSKNEEEEEEKEVKSTQLASRIGQT